MNKLLTALGTVSLLALSACGDGASETEVNNLAAEDLTLPADENVALGTDTLGDQANALDTTNAVSDANLAADANLTANTADGNAIGNVTNSQ